MLAAWTHARARCRRVWATRRCARSWAARPSGSSRARTRCGLGPAPGASEAALHPLLDRVVTHLISAIGRAFGGGDPDEPLALARLACAVGEDAPHADVCAAVLELLDLYREHLAPPPPGRPFPLAGRFIIAALTVARTPAVALPPGLHLPPPTREEADA